MSYILNALRKSERERQAIEPDTVTSRIVVQQPPHHKSSTKLIAALIVINLSVLIYVLGFTQKNPPVPEQTIATEVKPALSPAKIVSPSPAPKTPPIAQISKTDSQAPVMALPAKIPTVKNQPVKPVKPVIAPPLPPASPKPTVIKSETPPSKSIEPLKEAITPLKPAAQPIALAGDATEKTVLLRVKNDLPFLEDLPSEVSRSLPNLPINVFSYSSIAAERFVMIDMVKYVPGQRIKDQLELREIREDSIVVNFDNRTFKIRRP
ncbi:MAG: general secretion pathway protein GspB [Methylomonas sp.]|jgi:general secretion pathway protein B|uniref:general secretion pathway protein GspB n=1 Tax=Methylomonas sp. TaxID=418 RepID=UPI0025E45E54|nr:general secretion pathway protein GspB [Methylomonas sp.]MCK9605961.1 general secretion pathway protein GspB [Methylomonas sp.]